MVKQILILLFLLVTCFWGKAGNENDNNFHGDITSPAIRNNLKFNYDHIAGVKMDEQVNFSDDFNLPQLRLLWPSNISEYEWSLQEHPGFLRIKAKKVLDIERFISENTFSQKVKYNSSGEAVSFIDLTYLSKNSNAGLFFSSKRINYISIETNKIGKRIIAKVNDQIFIGPEISETLIMFRVKIESTKGWFEYSFDGLVFNQLGPVFQLNALTNDTIGLFCLSKSNEKGSIDIDWFYFNTHNDNVTKFAENEHNILNFEL